MGGLLAVSIDGEFYFPCYDQIGSVVCYVSESGAIAAQYVYDPYGNVIVQCGALADAFPIRFSTKYTDVGTGLISYLRRFYHPPNGRWLNRDPIEEEGGENLCAFCGNCSVWHIDFSGLIPVMVVTYRRNNIFQGIANGGDRFSYVQVRSVEDIEVGGLVSSTLLGLFVPGLTFEDCSLVIMVQIYLRDDLAEKGNKRITYFYKPHKGEADSNSLTSDGSPRVGDSVLAHERGHALSFMSKFIDMFRKEVAHFKAGNLSESDKNEVRRIFERCRRSCADDSARKASEAQIDWYKEHGFDFEIR